MTAQDLAGARTAAADSSRAPVSPTPGARQPAAWKTAREKATARTGTHTSAGGSDSSSIPSGSPAGPIVIVAIGAPKPKGSLKHVGNGRMIEQLAGSKPWRQAVKHAVLEQAPGMRLTGPVSVRIVYTVTRPATHFRTGRNAHLLRDTAPAWPHNRTSGDCDKQARNVLDALEDSGLIADDAQVYDLWIIKTYPLGQGGHHDALDTPGAVIRIQPAPLFGEAV
jgi:Holliday junction resolvase RusA-like endonuclease